PAAAPAAEAAPEPSAAAAAAPAPAAESAELVFTAGHRVAAVRVGAAVGGPREADVGVAAARGLRLLQRDVGQSLELRIHHAPRRGRREEIGNQVAAGDDESCRADGLDEVSACW